MLLHDCIAHQLRRLRSLYCRCPQGNRKDAAPVGGDRDVGRHV